MPGVQRDGAPNADAMLYVVTKAPVQLFSDYCPEPAAGEPHNTLAYPGRNRSAQKFLPMYTYGIGAFLLRGFAEP